MTLAIAVFIVLVIVSVPAYGYYANLVVPPKKVVLSVNGVSYTRGDMVDALRVIQAAYRSFGQNIDLGSAPFQVLNNLVEEELVRQSAPKLGVEVTPQEVDDYLKAQFYPPQQEGQTTPKEQLDREYKENIRNYLNQTKQSEDEMRDKVRLQLLRDKARAQLGKEVPTVAEQVNLQWILVDSQDKIDQIKDRLGKGEDFAALAKEFAQPSGFGAGDGNVGWVPKGVFPELDETIFKLEPGKVSDPVAASSGAYFLRVTQAPETREVSAQMLEMLKDKAMSDWIANEIKSNNVKTSFDSDDYDWIVKQLRQASSQTQTQQGATG